MFTHELSFLHCTIVYPTGLRDERKQPDPQVVSCSINCVLPTGKSGIKMQIDDGTRKEKSI